jgi:hypothetical protein
MLQSLLCLGQGALPQSVPVNLDVRCLQQDLHRNASDVVTIVDPLLEHVIGNVQLRMVHTQAG